MSDITINWPSWSKVINEAFLPIVDYDGRFLLLWGGRNGSKSVSACIVAIYHCLTQPYFKGLLIRKTAATIDGSIYETMVAEIERLGLSSLFRCTTSPLPKIRCVNGNVFLCRGLDKPQKIKGVKDPNFVIYEEGNEMDAEDMITVSSCLRGPTDFFQEILLFNPEVTGDYQDHWIYKDFGFHRHKDNSFEDEIVLDIDGEKEILKTRSIHTTYHDNRFVSRQSIAILLRYKVTNPYYYTVYTDGEWGNREVGSTFYRCFKESLMGTCPVDSSLELYLSFDENVHPYLTLNLWQAQGKDAWQIDEICLEHPKNTLKDVCQEFKNRYPNTIYPSITIMGDRTSKKEDVKLEKGQDFFTLAQGYLGSYITSINLPSKNPSVKARGQFINEIFDFSLMGIRLRFDHRCKIAKMDYMNVIEAHDGTKLKKVTKDKVSGVSYQKHGHSSDANDYFICQHFIDEFNTYLSGGKSFDPATGSGLTHDVRY